MPRGRKKTTTKRKTTKVSGTKKKTPLQAARANLNAVSKKYKDGKATLADVQKAGTRLAEVSCKTKK